MISLEEARSYVLAGCRRPDPSTVTLGDALGLAIAEDVVARDAIPPFPNTAMDGYAVRASDTTGAPVTLRMVGTLSAGSPPTREVGSGEALRIMTGAPMPPGADAVVMVEHTAPAEGGEAVVVNTSVSAGSHVRDAGEDITPGQQVFARGTVLGPGHLGVLASLGREQVWAYPRPRVGVLSTGDELVDGARPLRPGQIRDSNRVALLGLVRKAGCTGVDLGLVRDSERDITAAIERGARDCDALITSGGVSMGAFDYVKVVLDRLGEMRWMQVAIKPAKPLAFGTVQGVPVFGLPGNPVSSMVSFELFTGPALRKMMGYPDSTWVRATLRGVAAEDLTRHADGKIHFVRVQAAFGADGRCHVRSAGAQGSHQLLAMANANALAVLPDGDAVPSGSDVDVVLLDP